MHDSLCYLSLWLDAVVESTDLCSTVQALTLVCEQAASSRLLHFSTDWRRHRPPDISHSFTSHSCFVSLPPVNVGGNALGCVCLSVLTFESLTWFMVHKSRSISYIKVIGSRWRSWVQKTVHTNTHICRWSTSDWKAILLVIFVYLCVEDWAGYSSLLSECFAFCIVL